MTSERTCPHCQGRGFTYDSVDYDGFYASCPYCDWGTVSDDTEIVQFAADEGGSRETTQRPQDGDEQSLLG